MWACESHKKLFNDLRKMIDSASLSVLSHFSCVCKSLMIINIANAFPCTQRYKLVDRTSLDFLINFTEIYYASNDAISISAWNLLIWTNEHFIISKQMVSEFYKSHKISIRINQMHFEKNFYGYWMWEVTLKKKRFKIKWNKCEKWLWQHANSHFLPQDCRMEFKIQFVRGFDG